LTLKQLAFHPDSHTHQTAQACKTLLFLPGTACDSRVWRPVATALQQPIDAHFVDFATANSIDEMAAIALRSIDSVSGPVIPIGLSMGGLVALEMWRQSPSRIAGMLLCGTDPSADSPPRRSMRQAQMEIATTAGFGAMLETLAEKYFALDATANLIALQHCVTAMAQQQGIPKLIAQHAALATRKDCWPLLPSIKVPVLILCGEADQICLPATHMLMAEAIQGAAYSQISQAAHLAPLQRPQQVAQYIDDWLRSCNF
jgi:pimeloyl-ACP methyl ester carboxylesterase